MSKVLRSASIEERKREYRDAICSSRHADIMFGELCNSTLMELCEYLKKSTSTIRVIFWMPADENTNIDDISITNKIISVLEMLDEEYSEALYNYMHSERLEMKFAWLNSDNCMKKYSEEYLCVESGDTISVIYSCPQCEGYTLYADVYSIETKDISYLNGFREIWTNAVTGVCCRGLKEVLALIDEFDSLKPLLRKSKTYLAHPDKSYIIKPQEISLMDYQNNAINSWRHNKYCGLYDMATGTGKTITALAGIELLANELNGTLGIIVVCPYKHLVDQWEEDFVRWGVNPIICHSDAHDSNWEDKLVKAYKRFKNTGKSFTCITTNRSFVGNCFQQILADIDYNMNVVLVIDEVHNFGAENLRKCLPTRVKYRLGLSATIERYMDSIGTDEILKYFGKRCIEYGIEKAINDGKALCPYEYYPVIVNLNAAEKEKYSELTRKLGDYILSDGTKTYLSDAGKVILYERARVLAGAIDKKYKLYELIKPYKNKKNILVYCGATEDTETGERQIDTITNMLNDQLDITAQKFTAEENANERLEIKRLFADGIYQVLTAIRCLDEGVNIPGIETAFILASGRNPKEFIQRRGRLLRRHPGKEKAVIYDFVVLPTATEEIDDGDFAMDKAVVVGELTRVKEFGRLAINSEAAEEFIDGILKQYQVEKTIDELISEMEGYYDI